ncbi:MAG: NYN domain-containing protein [Pararhodobacter sp.]
MDLSPAKTPAVPAPCRAVALLIDGENTPSAQAGPCIRHALALGPVTVLRVYGDARRLHGWHEAPGFRLVHAHSGKNVTDILLTIEAMELAFSGSVDGFALATNDRDFAPLAQSLRARGFPVLGLVGASAPAMFRKSCTRVIALPATPTATSAQPPAPAPVTVPSEPSPKAAARVILAKGGITPQAFAQAMAAAGHRIPEGSASWRAWLTKTFTLHVAGTGQEARMTLPP